MSDTKKCPMCAELILHDAKKCRFCGEILDKQMLLKASSDRLVALQSDSRPNRGLAAVFSFFFPGLGQIYSGKVLQGFVWFFVVCFGYVCFIIPGLILHVVCIVEAANHA